MYSTMGTLFHVVNLAEAKAPVSRYGFEKERRILLFVSNLLSYGWANQFDYIMGNRYSWIGSGSGKNVSPKFQPD